MEGSGETTPLGGEPIKRQLSAMGRAFQEGPWPEDMNMLEATINVLMFFDMPPSAEVLANAFEKYLWPSHRFNSCMGKGNWERRHKTMDRSYHFREIPVNSETEIDEWVQQAMVEPLSKDFPVWRVSILKNSRSSLSAFGTSNSSRSAMFTQMHHAIGDGLSMLFAFSPMLSAQGGVDPISTISLPAALMPPALRKKKEGSSGSSSKSGCCCSCSTPCSFMKGLLSPAFYKMDAELKINAPLPERLPYLKYNGRRKYTRFPVVPFSKVTAIRQKCQCSVNDIIMAALTGALRRYGAEIRKDEKLQDDYGQDLEFKSIVMIALPRPVNVDKPLDSLTNKMLFASCSLPISETTPDARLQATQANFNNLKSKPYLAGVVSMTDFVKGIAPQSLLRTVISETFSKHSLLVTNVPCFSVPVTVPQNGETMKEIHMVFPNLIPQVSILTYDGWINANIVADPELYPNAEALGNMFLEEFDRLHSAVA